MGRSRADYIGVLIERDFFQTKRPGLPGALKGKSMKRQEQKRSWFETKGIYWLFILFIGVFIGYAWAYHHFA